MMKTFSDDAKKILMETMDGGKGSGGPNTNSALAFHLSSFVETCTSNHSYICKSAEFHRKMSSFPIKFSRGIFSSKTQPFVW